MQAWAPPRHRSTTPVENTAEDSNQVTASYSAVNVSRRVSISNFEMRREGKPLMEEECVP